MTSRRRLEGGRGLYQGDEAFIDQGESFQSRRPVDQTGAVFSNVPYYALFNAGAVTANRALFHSVPAQSTDYVISAARIRVSVGNAGDNARTAIFTFDPRERIFVRIPGSEALFDSTTAGLIEADLPREVRLVAGRPYFVAFKSSSATPTYALFATGNDLLNRLHLSGSAGALPSTVKLSELTRAATGSGCPGVAYLSSLWKDVL